MEAMLVSEQIEKILGDKFPNVFSKYTNQNSHMYELQFPKNIQDANSIKLILYVRNAGMKYTFLLPCKIESAKLERMEKMR